MDRKEEFTQITVRKTDGEDLRKRKKDPTDGTNIWVNIRNALDMYFGRSKQSRHAGSDKENT